MPPGGFEVRTAQPGDAPVMAELIAAVAQEGDGIATEPPVDIGPRAAFFAAHCDQAYSDVRWACGLLRAVCVGTHMSPLRAHWAPNAR